MLRTLRSTNGKRHAGADMRSTKSQTLKAYRWDPFRAVRISGVATRFEDEGKFLVTEICKILEPTIRTLEPALADVLKNRIRGGDRLPEVTA